MTAADPATSTVLPPLPDPRTAVFTGAGGPAGIGRGKYTHYNCRMKAATGTNRRTNLPARCQAQCDSTSVCLPGSSSGDEDREAFLGGLKILELPCPLDVRAGRKSHPFTDALGSDFNVAADVG